MPKWQISPDGCGQVFTSASHHAHFGRAAVLQKIALKALLKVFDNIYFISDVEFLIAAAVGRSKELQFLLSEMLFFSVYRYTDMFWRYRQNFKAFGWNHVFTQQLIPI